MILRLPHKLLLLFVPLHPLSMVQLGLIPRQIVQRRLRSRLCLYFQVGFKLEWRWIPDWGCFEVSLHYLQLRCCFLDLSVVKVIE